MASIGKDRQGRRGPTVSVQEARVFLVLHQNAGKWLSSHEIAAQAPGVAERTIRAYTAKYARLGIVEVARVFPGQRFRLKDPPAESASDYVLKLRQAVDVFGLDLPRSGTVGPG